MKLSILIPAYNEAATVGVAVKRLLDIRYPCDIELVIVNDGSVDDTGDVLASIDDPRVVVTEHTVNRGKGAAVRTAAAMATGDYMLVFDADLEYSADDIISLLSPLQRGDAQVVADDKRFWVYDPGAHTVYRGDLPKELAADNTTNDTRDVPSLDQVKKFISRLMEHASVSGATPDNVGGQRAYTVRVSPKENGGLVGGADLAWDALNGVPLRIAVFAKGASSPVLELTASNVSYGPVDVSSFAVSPPPDAKVVEVSTPSGNRNGTPDAKDPSGGSTPVEGVDAVAKAVPFKLSAPATLADMTRNQVRLLHSSKDGAALVTYGQGLAGIAVLEQGRDSSKPADQSAPSQDSGGDHHGGLSLPTVSIDGVNAQELATPLGTVVRFERGGVAYTVIGSVSPAAAEAAARGL